MGIQAPSFKLEVVGGTLPANAALVTASYGVDTVTVTSGERAIATRTVCSGRLSDQNGASLLSMLRPTSGDWPLGLLRVVARGWEREMKCEVTIGATVDGGAPACAYVSGPIQIHTIGAPGQGSTPPRAGLVYAGLTDAHGPIVMLTVDVAIASGVHTRHEIGDAGAGSGSVVIGEPFELKRVVITNILGHTLELLPPFPMGVAPAGPLGIR